METKWKVVRRKNRRGDKPITERKGCGDECIGMVEYNVVERDFLSNPMEHSSLLKEIRRLQQAIEASVWGKYVLSAVRDVIQAKQACRLVGEYKSGGMLGSITCYGLGRFGETFSHVPKHQLALVLALRVRKGLGRFLVTIWLPFGYHLVTIWLPFGYRGRGGRIMLMKILCGRTIILYIGRDD